MKRERRLRHATPGASRLRAAGLRVTAPRLAILDLLRRDTSHPTAEEVYEQLRPSHPRLSLATVYVTLGAFAHRGLCRRMPTGGASQRFDGTLEAHHHALCTRCGRLFDVPATVYRPAAPPAELEEGLAVRGVQVTFEVLCRTCQDREEEQANRLIAVANLKTQTRKGGRTCRH